MPFSKTLGSHLPTMEEDIQKKWADERVFERSVQERDVNNQYVLYDGPPFATGLPHYGHVLASTLKDVFPRFHTMLGQRVERRFGWDCHGVPIEYEIEKQRKLSGKKDIEGMGIAAFNESCRDIVLTYTDQWRALIERLGRFVDMDNDYKTMDPEFMESVWNVFKTLFEKGYVYEDKKVVAYSPGLGTPLSNFEAGQNYKNVQDPSITVEFPLEGMENTVLLVWTTTPWTIPTNVAVALNPAIEYVQLQKDDGKKYILAKSRVGHYFKDLNGYTVTPVDVNKLINRHYEPMFHVMSQEDSQKAYYVIASDHVTDSDGTGAVHISPAFGEDDYNLGKQYKLPAMDFIDSNGKFPRGIPNYEKGNELQYDETVKEQWFKDADKPLIKQMKEKKRLFKHETSNHEYPHCWRTEKPLMYRAIPSWYVEVTAIKDKIIKNNKEANWYPDFVGEKRFHNWLENAKDWAISRNRYWGCPIPIWRNVDDPSDYFVIGSRAELESLIGKSLTDLHSHFIDEHLVKKDGKTYKRIPEVFDCWFESGAMPYAQAHYPFENKELFESTFPADFIAEGIDQTRGWFYTLMVLSTALFDKPAFKNCVVNGILLGDDGQKMSKSKRNYPAIELVFDKYGADPLRFLLLGSPATRAQELAVSEKDIENIVKKVFYPLMNIYTFFADKGNLLNFNPKESFDLATVKMPLNQWLFFSTSKFNEDIKKAYAEYNLIEACKLLKQFIEDLSQWFTRNAKKTFKQGSQAEQKEILQSLYYALNTLSHCMAPIAPFMADSLYRNVNQEEHSVHLNLWCEALKCPAQFKDAFDNMETVRKFAHLGHRIREEKTIRTRQPLALMKLPHQFKAALLPHLELLKTELNVKEVEWLDSDDNLLEEKIVLNSKVLGPKYKKEFSLIQKALARGEYSLKEGALEIMGHVLSSDEFSIISTPVEGVAGAKEGEVWIVLDTHITPELKNEGILRDLIRNVQNMRKKAGYSLGDTVNISFDPNLRDFVAQYKDRFYQETNTVLDDSFAADGETLKEAFDAENLQGVVCIAKQTASLSPRGKYQGDFSYSDSRGESSSMFAGKRNSGEKSEEAAENADSQQKSVQLAHS